MAHPSASATASGIASSASGRSAKLNAAFDADGEHQVDRQGREHGFRQLQVRTQEAGGGTQHETQDDGGEQVGGGEFGDGHGASFMISTGHAGNAACAKLNSFGFYHWIWK